MKYETMMKAVLDKITESVPMTGDSFERLAREVDTELHAYCDPRGGAGDTLAESMTPSPHILFHPPCFEAASKVTRRLRKEDSFKHSFMIEGHTLVAHMEDHCVQLSNPDQHQLKPIHAVTNRGLWQAANALLCMALALRPKSPEWMNCEASWNKGTVAIAACVGMLRIRRNHPDELLFNDPTQEVHPLDFLQRMDSHQEEITKIVIETLRGKKEA